MVLPDKPIAHYKGVQKTKKLGSFESIPGKNCSSE